jgi:hypothetical protein
MLAVSEVWTSHIQPEAPYSVRLLVPLRAGRSAGGERRQRMEENRKSRGHATDDAENALYALQPTDPSDASREPTDELNKALQRVSDQVQEIQSFVNQLGT